MNGWDLVVVGAGVLGCFHAYYAARRGLRTLLIEQHPTPDSASARNFGLIIPSGMPPGVWLDRAQASRQTYLELAEQVGFDLQHGGTLYVAHSELEQTVLREFSERAEQYGYHCRLLDAQQSVELNPLATQAVAGLHCPQDLRVVPRQLLTKLLAWYQETSLLHYLPQQQVCELRPSDSNCQIVLHSGEVHRAKHVIFCGGTSLPDLIPPRPTGSLQFCKLQMMRTSSIPVRLATALASGLSIGRYASFSISPSWEQLHAESEQTEHGIYILIVQEPDGRLVVGDSHVYSSTLPGSEWDPQVGAAIHSQAQRWFDLPDHEIEDRWHGVYTLPADGPDLDVLLSQPHPTVDIISGIGGKGMTTGPALAREQIERIFSD